MFFGFNPYGQQPQVDPQQAAANQVRATAGSSPSLGQMQQGMGGLMTNDTQQGAFDGFMGGLMQTLQPMMGGMVGSGFEALGMPVPSFFQPQAPQEPATEVPPPKEPTLSPYEQQIQKLMGDKGFSREQAIENQRNALELGTDYNDDGAVTGDEWAKYGKTPAGAAYRLKHEGPKGLLMTDRVEKGMKNAKKLAGIFGL